MVGVNTCASSVLDFGMHDEFKDIMSDPYGEVIRLTWIRGGPSGFVDENEATGLSRAVGQWQAHPPACPHRGPTTKRVDVACSGAEIETG